MYFMDLNKVVFISEPDLPGGRGGEPERLRGARRRAGGLLKPPGAQGKEAEARPALQRQGCRYRGGGLFICYL